MANTRPRRQDTNYKDLTEKVVLKEGETYVGSPFARRGADRYLSQPLYACELTLPLTPQVSAAARYRVPGHHTGDREAGSGYAPTRAR
jgi:hypothetical protein